MARYLISLLFWCGFLQSARPTLFPRSTREVLQTPPNPIMNLTTRRESAHFTRSTYTPRRIGTFYLEFLYTHTNAARFTRQVDSFMRDCLSFCALYTLPCALFPRIAFGLCAFRSARIGRASLANLSQKSPLYIFVANPVPEVSRTTHSGKCVVLARKSTLVLRVANPVPEVSRTTQSGKCVVLARKSEGF